MNRDFCVCICLALLPAAVYAAKKPHGASEGQTIRLWANADLEKLHNLPLISIVGQIDQVKSAPETGKRAYEATRDPGWDAEQASRLRRELEHRQVQFREYQKAFEEAQSLRETTGGINLIDEDFAITPEGGMEILQQRVADVQRKLDGLEDLARCNDIEPGALRGQ